MYEVKGAGIGLATMGDLRNRQKETLEAAQHSRMYLLNDGQPVAGLVSLQMMELLDEILEDRALGRTVSKRIAAIEDGSDELMDEDEFFAAADEKMAARGSAQAAARTTAKHVRR